jgi:hypothetical protein
MTEADIDTPVGPRLSIIVICVAIFAVTAFNVSWWRGQLGRAIPRTQIGAHVLGPVDVERACKSQQQPPYNTPAVLLERQNPFTWKCSNNWQHNPAINRGIDMNTACKDQYQRDAIAIVQAAGGAYWACVVIKTVTV